MYVAVFATYGSVTPPRLIKPSLITNSFAMSTPFFVCLNTCPYISIVDMTINSFSVKKMRNMIDSVKNLQYFI